MKNMKLRSILYASVVVMATGCANGSTGKSNEQTAAQVEKVSNVKVMSVSAKDVPQNEIYTSTVQAYATNNIAPQSPSRIQKIYVEVGDFVRAGQIVAKMDEVSLNQSRLSMTNDSLEYNRIKSLYEQGGVSKSDYDAMELKYNVTRSQYENLLENTVLRSPINGVITARNYDRGDMYAASPIYVVAQITPVKMYVGVSESDYTKVKKNDVVTLTVDAIPGKTFQGRIARIFPTMDAATHTFTVEVNVANTDRQLRPGMYARVTVNFGERHNVTVPDDCIVKQQGSGVRSVFVLQDNGTVKESVVTLGRHFDSEYEILSGLSEGDKVVIKGQASLKNGAKVNVQE